MKFKDFVTYVEIMQSITNKRNYEMISQNIIRQCFMRTDSY